MKRKRLLWIGLPPMIVGAALMVAVVLLKTRPTAERAITHNTATLVRVIAGTRTNERVRVVAMGTVVPAQEVVLQPQVSGRIVEQSPNLVPGGFFDEGAVIARIEARDYELAVEQQEAAVARAEFELKVEEGRRRIAEREWKLLEQEVPWDGPGRDLALRKPHMENVTAALEGARSALERAKIDLNRTAIVAPFKAVVREEFIDIGQMVSPQTRLATLIGTERFWVQVSVAVDRLAWIEFPGAAGAQGSKAEVVHEAGLGGSIRRRGSVVRLLGDLDPKGRMARVLVAVDDPFNLNSGAGGAGATSDGNLPLLVGAYVRVEIEGAEIERVVAIPRSALRDGDRVWIMDSEGKLAVRDVEVAWRRPQSVLVRSGVEDGEQIVISAISTPVPGMRLRLKTEPIEHAQATADAGVPAERLREDPL